MRTDLGTVVIPFTAAGSELDVTRKLCMRKKIKKALYVLGIGKLAEKVYFNTRSASPSVLARHIQFRRAGAPDGLPIPDRERIYAIIGCYWTSVYWDSGKAIIQQMQRCLQKSGSDLSAFSNILDFGCGSGRLLRHLPASTDATLFGSDLNDDLVRWCADNLPLATFRTNDLSPPIDFEDARFDFVFARSVFTHLPKGLAREWAKELARVLTSDGVLYISTHGEAMAGGLTDDQLAELANGQLVETYAEAAGENLCSTWAYRGWVEKCFEPYFEIAYMEPGAKDTNLRQDVYILRKRPH